MLTPLGLLPAAIKQKPGVVTSAAPVHLAIRPLACERAEAALLPVLAGTRVPL